MPEVYAYSIQQVMMKLTWHVNCHDPSQIFTTGRTASWSTRCVHRRAYRLGCEEPVPRPLRWRENRSQSTTSLQEPLQCRPLPHPPFYGASDDLTGGMTIAGLRPEQERAPATHNSIIVHCQMHLRYNHHPWHKAYLHISNIVTPMKCATVFNHTIQRIQHLILSRPHHQRFL